MSVQVLFVSIPSNESEQIIRAIQEKGKNLVTRVSSLNEVIKTLQNQEFHILLCDGGIHQEDVLQVLHFINGNKSQLPFVYLSKTGNEQFLEHLFHQGAYDDILKKDGYLAEIASRVVAIYERFSSALEHQLETDNDGKGIFQDVNARAYSFAVRDELTGVFNHRFFQQELYSEFLRARRYGYSLSCLMIDIDYFRTVNDTKGHSVGDQVLKELAQTLLSLSKQTDVVVRYGGEEFVILLPHLNYEQATEVAEKIRDAVSKKTFLSGQYDGQYNLKLTVSIGVSSYPDDPIQEYDDLTAFADKALFRAKGKKGRNSVASYMAMMKEMEAKTPALKFSENKITEFRRRLIDISETAKRAYIDSTKTLVYALEAKDKYTLGHASRVAQYAAMVARELNLPEDDVTTIEHAGLLHDVGKVCISDEVLLKPGAFTVAEYEKMKEHPQLGYQIIKPIKFLMEEALIILHHHEWFNGKGYPHHLKGKEISVGARIVAVLDAYDTMRAAGARYKKTLGMKEIVSELIGGCGTQFDPEVIAALIRVLVKRGEIEEGSYDKEKLSQAMTQSLIVNQ